MNHAGNQPSVADSEEQVMDSRRLSIELREDLAEIVDALVESGSYADASEVIQEALELFTAQDAPLEDWVRTEMVAAYDEWKANPSGGLTIDEVREHLRKAREERQLRA
ncbi:MAG TPA: type II toxin-antitoxin system ParD family antitoxin [Allosphingosinicella sp.]